MSTTTATTIEFLEALWPDGLPDGCAATVCRFKPDRVRRCSTLEDAADLCAEWSNQADVYVGCGLQPPSGTGRGKAEDVLTIPGLWADVDFVKPDSKKPYPPTEQHVLNLLDHRRKLSWSAGGVGPINHCASAIEELHASAAALAHRARHRS